MPTKNITQKTCAVENCNSPAVTLKLCNRHYKRYRTYGQADAVTLFNCGEGATTEERFWSRVNPIPTKTGCIEWSGSVNRAGYGSILWQGKRVLTHRVAWFLAKGEMPLLCLLHSCDNPRCLNVEHLREGTRADNNQDKMIRGRQTRGITHPRVILTEAAVREIRKRLMMGEICRTIGELYGVSQRTIADIKYGRSWKHLS